MVEGKERKSRLLGAGEIAVSFEFFPPKTEKMEEQLWSSITRLAPLAPEFVSVTYGAGGTTRERTHATVERIVKETDLRPAAHLTCVDATREEVDAVAQAYWNAGVRHIVALRGDPASGAGQRYEPHDGGYVNAAELVAGLKKIANFEISVAGYPEKHPESPTLQADMDNLKAKVDAGAVSSRSSASITRTTCASSNGPAPPASGFRSRPASCRSTTSVRSPASRSARARPFPHGSPAASKASTTIRRRRRWSPLRSRPNK
jgi:Methylenetetrahydrofolate reductase